MKRLQNRIGLGEIHLPDERKRPAVREPAAALVGAGAAAALPRRPHDPTHPAVEGATRPGAARPAPRPGRPPQPQAPSVSGTTRMPSAGQPSGTSEPTTTRLSVAAKNAAKAVINNASAITQRTQRAAPPPREEREIESWLGELRGSTPPEPPAAQPSADATRAMPAAAAGDAAETTAIPVQRPMRGEPPMKPTAPPAAKPDPESTEKLPKQQKTSGGRPDDERRRGGGVSAQDLLRREGRL
jgi:RND superfamily putative drug exporter